MSDEQIVITNCKVEHADDASLMDGLTVQDASPDMQKAFVENHIKAVNAEEMEILHLISTGTRDRSGDIVKPKGAYLKNYRKNPLVLANHSYAIENVIGRCVNIDVSDDGIWARTKFRDTELARSAFNLAAENLGGWSIGFKPMKRHTIKQGKDEKCQVCSEIFDQLAEGKSPGDYVPESWGLHFLQWELLEYSCVAIPCNQEIVNNAVQRGLVPEAHVERFFTLEPDKPEKREAEQATPGNGPTVDPARVERIASPWLQKLNHIFTRADAERQVRRIASKL